MATYHSRRHNRNRTPYNLRRNVVNTPRAPRSSPDTLVIPDNALDYLDTDPWAGSSAQQRLEFAILGPQMQEEAEQLNLAIAQSLAELDKSKSSPKDNIINAMDEIKAEPTKQHLMKAKFANTKRAFGFGSRSIRYDKIESSGGPKTSSRFHKHLQDYLCVICMDMPYDMRYCLACKRYYCNTCLMNECSLNIGCPLRAKGNAHSSNGYKPQEILTDRKTGRPSIENSARNTLDLHVEVLCEFGEKSEDGEHPRYMDWTTAERHYLDVQCPMAQCQRCSLIKSDGLDSHENEKKCIESLNEFGVFLMAKHQLEMKEKTEEIERLKNEIKKKDVAHKNLNDTHNNVLTAYTQLLEKNASKEDPTPNRLKDLEKMVKNLSEKLCNTTDGQQNAENAFSANLMSHPIDSDFRYHSPIVYINHFELVRREIKGLSRQSRLSDLVKETKKLWDISP